MKYMNRIKKPLVVVIIGLIMLGFGMVTAVSAVKPPFRPPTISPYPDAVWIEPGLYDNVILQSDASFITKFWTYYVDPEEPVDETALFPQPIRCQVWIDGEEIKLSRSAIGNGHIPDPHYVSPVYIWYAYFEPGYFSVGEHQTHVTYTCKDPNNSAGRMVVWNTLPGPGYGVPLDFDGLLTVLDG